MKLVNSNGEAVYYNCVTKHGKDVWVIQGIGGTTVKGRDRQKLKSRTFTKGQQADAYLERNGFKVIY